MDEVIACPTTPNGWKDIAKGFSEKWTFEHAVGAIDEKHIWIIAPPHSGSYFFNYKGFHSIVLLGVAHYNNYEFIYASVSANGATCDGQVFYSSLYRALVRKEVGLPPKKASSLVTMASPSKTG